MTPSSSEKKKETKGQKEQINKEANGYSLQNEKYIRQKKDKMPLETKLYKMARLLQV